MRVSGKTVSIEFLKLFTSLEIHLASQVCSSEIVDIATLTSDFNPLISKCNTALKHKYMKSILQNTMKFGMEYAN